MTPEQARELRHELRTPVNHLIGYSELLLEEEGLPEGVAPQLDSIRAMARRVLELLPEILRDDGTIDGGAGALNIQADELVGGARALRATAAGFADADLERIASAADRLKELSVRLAGKDLGVSRDTGSAQGRREGERETILVVDDDEANRDVLGRRLQRLGYGVEEARDGIEALARLAGGGIDLMLLDVMMPRLDGYGVLEELRYGDNIGDVPVIMISALDQVESIARCIELGAEDYLPKPFDPLLLKARLGASLEKKRLRDAQHDLLETVRRQAAELAAWNRDLEARVSEKMGEVERLSRLERFLSPQVAEAVTGGTADVLASHRREVSVLFCDLRGFTSFSETSEPEDVMAVLNEYHAALVPLVFEHRGTLVHFTGDGMMVVFNDPMPLENHASEAVALALDMQGAVGGLAAQWQGRGHRLGMGVGIATGYATCGAVGHGGRYEYTAIGTVCNVASRLCSEAADGQVLVNRRVRSLLRAAYATAPAGELALKGIARPIEAFAVMDRGAPARQ